MAKWLIDYWPYVNCDLDSPNAGTELPCFRIYPGGEPHRWIAQTNPDLPIDVQAECAQLIAAALSDLLGV